MGEFSKFKAITIVIILLFIFAVAAMYTNTKEAAENKVKSSNDNAIEENQDELNQVNVKEKKVQKEENSSDEQIQNLTNRLDNLERAFNSSNNNGQELKCFIKGISDNGVTVPLSPEESVTEARANNKDIVVTCRF